MKDNFQDFKRAQGLLDVSNTTNWREALPEP